MYPASAAFYQAMTADHAVVTQVNIYSPAGSFVLGPIPVTDGSVTIDRTQANRRTCNVTLALTNLSWAPTTYQHPLSPFSGNGMVISSGVAYGDGTTEVVPVGTFAIIEADLTDSGTDLQAVVQGADMSWIIGQRGFSTAFSVGAGQDVSATIQQLVSYFVPNITYNIASTTGSSTPPTNFTQGSDPWSAALQIANGYGYELFFDVNNICTGYPTPVPNTLPVVWDFNEGANNSASVLARTLTRNGVYNDFVVVSSATTVSPPIQGEVTITDTTSPLYIFGPLGDVPFFTSNEVVTTTGQCIAAAASLANQQAGAYDLLTITSWPIPLFDIDDVVQVNRARLGLSGALYVVDQIQHQFRHDGQTTLTCRAV